MLFIIDMQNQYINPESKRYIKGADNLVPGIMDKIKDYEKRGDQVFYTADINLLDNSKVNQKSEVKIDKNNDRKALKKAENQLSLKSKINSEPYGNLKPLLEKHNKIKKAYYAIPPETLLEIQQRFKDEKTIINKIEVLGVETNICVLANAICLQSAFPQATIIVDAVLCMSQDKTYHEYALKTMESLIVCCSTL